MSLALYGRLPELGDRTPSTTFHDTAETRLGQAIARRVDREAHESGILALANGLDAFAARALSIEAADRSIDIQYDIWQEGLSGILLFEALVSVR